MPSRSNGPRKRPVRYASKERAARAVKRLADRAKAHRIPIHQYLNYLRSMKTRATTPAARAEITKKILMLESLRSQANAVSGGETKKIPETRNSSAVSKNPPAVVNSDRRSTVWEIAGRLNKPFLNGEAGIVEQALRLHAKDATSEDLANLAFAAEKFAKAASENPTLSHQAVRYWNLAREFARASENTALVKMIETEAAAGVR